MEQVDVQVPEANYLLLSIEDGEMEEHWRESLKFHSLEPETARVKKIHH